LCILIPHQPQGEKKLQNPIRILIADDHELLRRGVCTLLTDNGFEVCCEAENGKVAVEKVQEFKPDLAILDITMPVMNGLEAARAISRDVPNTKVLILTMHNSPQIADVAREAGAAAFVLKSSAATDLVATVRRLFETNHQPHASEA